MAEAIWQKSIQALVVEAVGPWLMRTTYVRESERGEGGKKNGGDGAGGGRRNDK